MKTTTCPECGSKEIGKGYQSGYANMIVKGRMFSSSPVEADICSECGLIISFRVRRPKKFRP